MPADKELLFDIRDRVATITLNRPEVGNALSSSLLRQLKKRLEGLDTPSEAMCVVLRGEGSRAFCVGMDLGEMIESDPEANYRLISRGGPLRSALDEIDAFPFPTVAMIRGYAFGAGLELALACDIRIASENSRVGMPPARLGIVYPPEGIYRFMEELGPAATRKLFLTARQFDAHEGKGMGLLDWVVPDEVLDEFTYDIAGSITRRAPLSLAGMKRSISVLQKSGKRAATEPEIMRLVRESMASEDAAEGLAAFEEKREPRFKGR